MAKESGVNVLLQVSDGAGSPTAFVTVAGQQSTEFVGDSETDDVTDKSQAGWGATLNVLRRGTINCSGKADWPDSSGLELVRLAWQGGLDIDGKAILNAAGAHYRGFWQVTSFNISGAQNNATEYSFTLQNNGALTYAAS
jgi:predicted secreted protein